MKKNVTMQAHQMEKFARFLEEHPGFAPLLMGQDALVCGFQVGGSYLRVEEMECLIATQPQFDATRGRAVVGSAGSNPDRRAVKS